MQRLQGPTAVGLVLLEAVIWWIFVSPIGAGVLPRAAREQLNRLLQAQEAIRQDRAAEAIPVLEQILSGSETGYVPVEGQEGLHVPLKRAAAMLLQSLPPEAQAMFEAWCAGKTVRRLDDALSQRDRQGLLRIVQEYPITGFAAQAALALAADAWDRGLGEQTGYWANKVLQCPAADKNVQTQAWLLIAAAHQQAGRKEQARQAFQHALALAPDGKLRIGADLAPKEKAIDGLMERLARTASQQPSDAASAASLTPADWPIVRGDATRNRSADPWTGRAEKLLWHLDLEEKEEIKNITEAMGRMGMGVQFGMFSSPIPACQPIGVGRLALVRLPNRLAAVELLTGRQQWEYPWGGDSTLRESSASRMGVPVGVRIITPFGNVLWQRIFEDALYGQMAASGNRLFLVDLTGEVRQVLQTPFPAALPAQPGMRSSYNRLVALDLAKQGKVLWTVGGRSGEDEPALAEAFFLGPPLPLEGVLYGLVEQKEQILLAALAEQTGQLLWSLPIAAPERGVAWEPQRRLAGATPSYANGVLICPTSAGAIVAVDPWQPTVLWAYETPLADAAGNRLRMIFNRSSFQVEAEHCSIDAAAMLVEDSVLAAPVESEELFCLQLHTGRLVWSRKIEQFRYLAGSAEGVVLTVGSHSVSGWQVHTGKPAWEEISLPLPEGFAVTGRGFRKDRSYYLPISKGEQSELLQIDIPTGRFENRLVLPTQKRLGNLAPVGSVLVSFSADGLEAFGPEQNR